MLATLQYKGITRGSDLPRRPRRQKEVFGLNCHRCERDVEVPAAGPYKCPRCGVLLNIGGTSK